MHARRLSKDQTQAEAAVELGIGAANYSQWETNEDQPKTRYWPDIIRYLGYDPICPNPATLGEKVAFLGRHLGLTVTELGRLVGANRHTLMGTKRNSSRTRKGLEARLDTLAASLHLSGP